MSTVRNFRRTRSVEEIRPKWSKIRLGIKRFVRDQRRKAQKKKKSILADRKTALTDHDVKSPNNAMTKKN
ncbi:dCTP deaminase [Dirofilaria immitis]